MVNQLKPKCVRKFTYSGQNGGGSESVQVFSDSKGLEWYMEGGKLVPNSGKTELRGTGPHCSVSEK